MAMHDDRAYPSPETVSFISSGNEELDARRMESHIRHEKRMIEGLCPNGCGPITQTDKHNQDCPVCGFHGYSSKGFPIIGETGEAKP